MPYLVQTIHADEFGGFALELNQGHTLSVFPDTSDESECWRFFLHGPDNPHFVMTGVGIESQDD